MSRLSRYIFREIVSGALLGALLFSIVLIFQRMSKLFELLVSSSASASTVGYLFLLTLPAVLIFTLPLGVLVGVLIGLSRMSSDGEMVALRAVGVPTRRALYPVMLFAGAATVLTAMASTWLAPLAIRETFSLRNELAAALITAEVQPRVFQEGFPQRVLYIGDVVPGEITRWRNVFIADLTPPHERSDSAGELGDAPRITLAREALAVVDSPNNRVQLSIRDGSTHEVGAQPSEYYSTSFPRGDQLLEAPPPDRQEAKPFIEMETVELMEAARESIDARIELHQRLALPLACVVLALVGLPLGISTRKAGKSAAFVITISLAFLYFLSLITLIGLARNQTLPVEVAVWAPNVLFGLAGIVMVARLEKPGDRDLAAALSGWTAFHLARLRSRFARSPRGSAGGGSRSRLLPLLLPQIIDAYVLSRFLYYFALLLVSFVVLIEVFNFFELLSDIIKRNIAMTRVATYLFFLAPKLIYDSAPMSVLVAVLITFGVLSKHNEVTAFKACGISLHRLIMPVILTSAVFSAGLFAFDYYYIPQANRIQDAIRDEIKGRPVQTYYRPERKWILGRGSQTIYYYKYLDPGQTQIVGVHVYEIDPESFLLKRHIAAESARWEPRLEAWVFQNGWERNLNGIRSTEFREFSAQAFPELDETPNWFLRELKLDKQMNFRELASYMSELSQTGVDTSRLQVQYHRKFAVPLFALIMALISLPFAFLAGNRGAMTGVGVSLGIAAGYWGISQLFEQAGNLKQLTAPLAAWSPDALFTLTGVYLLTRIRT